VEEELSTGEKNAEKKDFALRLGQRIREIRQQQGLTQEQLADKASYHPTYIGNIENATNLPSTHTVWRLAKAMDMDVGDLMRGL
jgi:XRE family transcriptional regulator, regulator of sulfur utilization